MSMILCDHCDNLKDSDKVNFHTIGEFKICETCIGRGFGMTELSDKYSDYFIYETYGSKSNIIFDPTQTIPEGLYSMVREVHGNMLPDDYKYTYIYDALCGIVDSEGNVDSARESIEADVYNGDLIEWLQSDLSRESYCIRAREEGLINNGMDTYQQIACGQYLEKCEVFDIVLRCLEEIIEREV